MRSTHQTFQSLDTLAFYAFCNSTVTAHRNPAFWLKCSKTRSWYLQHQGNLVLLCLAPARASHSQRMWKYDSSYMSHFLNRESSLTPINVRIPFRVLCPVSRPTNHPHHVPSHAQQPPSASCVLRLQWMESRTCLKHSPTTLHPWEYPGILVHSLFIPALINAVLCDPDSSLRAHSCLPRAIPCQIVSDLDYSNSKMSEYPHKLDTSMRQLVLSASWAVSLG